MKNPERQRLDRRSPYYRQVALLVRCLPHVAEESCFALKGGTAINLFVRDFPRLSVDIDLTYLPLEPRMEAIENIRASLARITEAINTSRDAIADLQDNRSDEMRIVVHSNRRSLGPAQIKIEVSPVARGTLYEVEYSDVVEQVEDEFGFATIQTVSIPDLYGGKLCAAMDRQHPRDLYDVEMLLQSTGIDRKVFVGFMAYLLSHNRPLSEVMNPRWKDIGDAFNNEFVGMTFETVSLQALQDVPAVMVESMRAQFTQADFDFLYSFKSGKPDWTLGPHKKLFRLPAIQWKLLNIQKMSPKMREAVLERLRVTLLAWLER